MGDGQPQTVDQYRLSEVERDMGRMFERTKGITEYGRRLKAIEEARENDRREFLAEVKDLRRTVVQAALAILGSAMAILIAIVQTTS
jgi:hypothetical protein